MILAQLSNASVLPRVPARGGANRTTRVGVRKIRLLVADPDQQFVDRLEQTLRHTAIPGRPYLELVASCQDGFSVLKWVDEATPDILLLDLILSQLDGLSVLDRLHRRALLPGFKVIVHTSLYDEALVARCLLELGVSYYVLKPFSLAVLLKRIVEVAEEHLRFDDRMFSTAHRLEQAAAEQLIALGVPPHYKGYQYLREAICMAVADPALLSPITKRLYPLVARRYQASVDRVERSMRHAIEMAWTRGNLNLLQSLFAYHIKQDLGRPSNSLFIARLADKIRLEAGGNRR